MVSALNLHESNQFRSLTRSCGKLRDAVATGFTGIHVGIAIASTYGIDDHGVITVLIQDRRAVGIFDAPRRRTQKKDSGSNGHCPFSMCSLLQLIQTYRP